MLKTEHTWICTFKFCGRIQRHDQYVQYPSGPIPMPCLPVGWHSIETGGKVNMIICSKHQVLIGPAGKKRRFGPVEDLTSPGEVE